MLSSILDGLVSYICICSFGPKSCATWAEAGGWAGRPVSGAPPPPPQHNTVHLTRPPSCSRVTQRQLVSTITSLKVNRRQFTRWLTGMIQVKIGPVMVRPVIHATKTYFLQRGTNFLLRYIPPPRQQKELPINWIENPHIESLNFLS